MTKSPQRSKFTPKRGNVRRVPAPKSVPNSRTPKKSTPKSNRHMYTNEEYRFVWFYRKDLQISRQATQQFFNEYFGHNPPITRNCVDQVYDRLKRTLPDDVICARHTEDWAVGANSGEYKTPAPEEREPAYARDESPEGADTDDETSSLETCTDTI